MKSLGAILLLVLGVASSSASSPLESDLVTKGDETNSIRLGRSLHQDIAIFQDHRNLRECYSACTGLGKEVEGKWDSGICCADDALDCCEPRTGLIWTIVIFVILTITLISCCCCACCPLYKRMHENDDSSPPTASAAGPGAPAPYVSEYKSSAVERGRITASA